MIDQKLKSQIMHVYQVIAPDLEQGFLETNQTVDFTSSVEMTTTCFTTHCHDAEALKLWGAIPAGSVMDVVSEALKDYF